MLILNLANIVSAKYLGRSLWFEDQSLGGLGQLVNGSLLGFKSHSDLKRVGFKTPPVIAEGVQKSTCDGSDTVNADTTAVAEIATGGVCSGMHLPTDTLIGPDDWGGKWKTKDGATLGTYQMDVRMGHTGAFYIYSSGTPQGAFLKGDDPDLNNVDSVNKTSIPSVMSFEQLKVKERYVVLNCDSSKILYNILWSDAPQGKHVYDIYDACFSKMIVTTRESAEIKGQLLAYMASDLTKSIMRAQSPIILEKPAAHEAAEDLSKSPTGLVSYEAKFVETPQEAAETAEAAALPGGSVAAGSAPAATSTLVETKQSVKKITLHKRKTVAKAQPQSELNMVENRWVLMSLITHKSVKESAANHQVLEWSSTSAVTKPAYFAAFIIIFIGFIVMSFMLCGGIMVALFKLVYPNDVETSNRYLWDRIEDLPANNPNKVPRYLQHNVYPSASGQAPGQFQGTI